MPMPYVATVLVAAMVGFSAAAVFLRATWVVQPLRAGTTVITAPGTFPLLHAAPVVRIAGTGRRLTAER